MWKLSTLPQLKNLESGSKKVFADYQHLVEGGLNMGNLSYCNRIYCNEKSSGLKDLDVTCA